MNLLTAISSPGMFRLLLASAVVFYHLSRFSIGSAAVYIFFVLSGYWIYVMWVNRYSKADRPLLVYLISRAWRLIPAFALISAIALLLGGRSVIAASANLHAVLSQLFILGYDTLAYKPIVPAWSLDIEMQFYLLAPALVWIVSRTKGIGVLVLFSIISICSYFWLGGAVFSYLVFFTLGMNCAATGWTPSKKLVTTFSGVALAIIVLLMLSPVKSIVLVGAHPGPYSIYNPQLNILVAIAFIPFALFTTKQKGSQFDGMFADLSYILYLLHWPVLQFIQRSGWIKSNVSSALTVVITSYLLSFLLWKYYDKPINGLRAQWVKRRIRQADYTAPAVPKKPVSATNGIAEPAVS